MAEDEKAPISLEAARAAREQFPDPLNVILSDLHIPFDAYREPTLNAYDKELSTTHAPDEIRLLATYRAEYLHIRAQLSTSPSEEVAKLHNELAIRALEIRILTHFGEKQDHPEFADLSQLQDAVERSELSGSAAIAICLNSRLSHRAGPSLDIVPGILAKAVSMIWHNEGNTLEALKVRIGAILDAVATHNPQKFDGDLQQKVLREKMEEALQKYDWYQKADEAGKEDAINNMLGNPLTERKVVREDAA